MASTRVRTIIAVASVVCVVCACVVAQQQKEGYTDTPYLPDGKWRVHDADRPHPPAVTPGSQPGLPPSDAVVLFDGKDLSKWQTQGGKIPGGSWKVGAGYFECAPGTGSLVTKEKFGDCQLHVEWCIPEGTPGSSQSRGNSGVMLMSRYEIQVLDSNGNITYADGQAAAMYGQYPPFVNASRKQGEWQTYDIVFEAPRFEGEKIAKPAYLTLFHNGVLMHNHQAFIGQVAHKLVGKYSPHSAEEPLLLQDHSNPIRFRNIWVRRLKLAYD
jgi:hypothetical protein